MAKKPPSKKPSRFFETKPDYDTNKSNINVTGRYD